MTGVPLRVLSYNVHGLRDDRSALVGLIRDLAPDVVIVQEAPRRFRWRHKCAALADDVGMVVAAGGLPALGNLLLDTPEVMEVKKRFKSTDLAIEPQFALLATAKIVAPEYGTRCSTVLLSQGDGRMQFAERAFGPSGADGMTMRYELPGTA